MGRITIRLDQATTLLLRIRAEQHGRSMEDEAREILRGVLATEGEAPVNLAAAIRARVEPLGGIELELPPREPLREPPDLG